MAETEIPIVEENRAPNGSVSGVQQNTGSRSRNICLIIILIPNKDAEISDDPRFRITKRNIHRIAYTRINKYR